MENKIEIAVFSAGCFWCTEAVFQRFEGVHKVVSGYTGGHIKNPAYREVCMGVTGHAEGVEITFNPAVFSYNTLLEVFFATHDPTTLNQQANDKGTQYRSAIFYASEIQKNQSLAFIEQLSEANVFENEIVTEVSPLENFYYAEVDHHDYYNKNTAAPYCQFLIAPKIEKIKKFYSNKLKQK